MKLQVTCAILLLAFLSESDARAPEASKLADFVRARIESFDAAAEGLDPLILAPARDLFVINPNLEIGGDIWDVSFGGYSKLEDLLITAELDIRPPPEKFYASYTVNFTFPVLMTGNYKLSGVWTENDTQIPIAGEGGWTLNAKFVRRNSQHGWEEPEGYLKHVSGTLGFDLVDNVLDIPGLFGADVPANVAQEVTKQIYDEIKNIYDWEFNIDLSIPLSRHIEEGLQETPFYDIVGTFSPPPEDKQWAAPPPAESWPELDLFLAKTMDKFGGSPAQGLDPLRDLDVSINITWPQYLNLQGTISNLTFHGISEIRHAGSYSPVDNNMFYVLSDYVNAYLSGVHNITGTWTLESGEVVQVGGVESQFTFKSKPAKSTLAYGYSLDSTSTYLVLDSLLQEGFGLKDGEYSTNFDGLLDAIPEGGQKDQGIAWIQDGIQTPVAKLIISRIEYRVTKFLDNAFKQTTYEEIINPTNARK